MNPIPNNSNIPAVSYMNGSSTAAGSNMSLPSAALNNGAMGGGMMVAGQMAPNHQAALYQYQQQLHAQQMNPYVKMPTQMLGPQAMMGVPPEASPSHSSSIMPTMPANSIPGANAALMSNPNMSHPNAVAAQQQQLLVMNRAAETQNQIQIDKARVTLLLEINAELLRESVQLQAAGKIQQEDKQSDKGFYGCMRRLQANLAYLAAVADGSRKPGAPIPQCPAVLVPPPDMPSLVESYKKLQSLFPGGKTQNASVQAVGQSQSQSRASSQNASPRTTHTPRPPSHHGSSQSPRNQASPTPPTQSSQQPTQQQQIQQQLQHQQHMQMQHPTNMVAAVQAQQMQPQPNQMSMQQHPQMQSQPQLHHPLQMTTQMPQSHMMAPQMAGMQMAQQQPQQQQMSLAAIQHRQALMAQAQAQFNQLNQQAQAQAQAQAHAQAQVQAQRQVMQPMQAMGFNAMPMMIPQGMGQGIPQGLPQGMPQGMPQGIPQTMSQGMPQGMPMMQAQPQMYMDPSQQSAGTIDMSAWGYRPV